MSKEDVKEFEKVIDYWDGQFIALCDMRIMEAEFKIEAGQQELKHWKEMKEVFLQTKKQ